MLIRKLDDMVILGVPAVSSQPVRNAARAVLFDAQGRIAVVHVHRYEHITLPGGGIEADETPKAAVVREVREETGYDCLVTDELGYIDENRGEGDYVQRSYYFIAHTRGRRGRPKLTEKEKRVGVTLEWYSLEALLDVVSSVPHEVMQRKFIQRRDIAVLTKVALFSEYALPIGGAVSVMRERLCAVLGGNITLYLHGSVTMGDYRRGWSDIDILCLTKTPLTEAQLDALLMLRQELVNEMGDNIFRSFEGGILDCDAFLRGERGRAVYWGTSGQRVTDDYAFDVFSRLALIDDGVLLMGGDVRDGLERPGRLELNEAIRRELDAVTAHAGDTGESVYSAGWLFDIARCLYTLDTGKIAPKTRAMEWALQKGLCPKPDVARRALKLRRAPIKYLNEQLTRAWLASLATDVLDFAAVLREKLAEKQREPQL